jgi:serine/threonine-protein kinase
MLLPFDRVSSPSALGGAVDCSVGPFRILSPLSKGGMATVDLARPADGGPVCVLKQLHGALETDHDAARRFAREAQLATLLDHPNIARLVGSGRAGGRLYIATELVRGVTFEQLNRRLWPERRPVPVPLALGLILPVLRALEHAHALRDEAGRPVGLVHRDLSSKNLMVDAQGRVKIIDFGVAKGAVDDHRTATGMLMGTPLYMSPEQAAGRRVDHRSDLYTVGVVLWELLAGRRLVRAKGPAQMLMAVSKEPAPDLSTLRPEIPRPLNDVIRRALQKAPTARFESARSFLAALTEASGSLGVADEAAVAGWVQTTMHERFAALDRLLKGLEAPPAAAPTSQPSASSDSRGAPGRSRSRPRLSVIVAAALLLAAGWMALVVRPTSRPSELGAREPSGPNALPAPASTAARVEPRAVPDPSPAAATSEASSAKEISDRPSPRDSTSTDAARARTKRRARPAPREEVAPAAAAPQPAAPSSLARFQPLLDRYRQVGGVGAATELYGELRRYARGPAAPDERSCIEAVLGALDFLKYDDIASAAPLFAEALDCLRHREGP